MIGDLSLIVLGQAAAEYELAQISRAHKLFSRSIAREVDNFKNWLKRNRNANPFNDADVEDRIDSRYADLIGLERINNYSAVVLAYAALERFFMRVFNSGRLEILELVGQNEE